MVEHKGETCKQIHGAGEDAKILKLTFPLRRWNSLQVTFLNFTLPEFLPTSE